jgi:hypothetical protein
MTNRLRSFTDIIGLWPSLSDLAREMGAPAASVRQWKVRDRIPATWWDSLLTAATKRKFRNVNASLLLTLSDQKRRAA